MKYLIVNADDFGLSPGVNRGIVEAYLAGGITSTTLMVNMPGFEDAIIRSLALPNLGVGLHFNLTSGIPISHPNLIPSLVQQDGTFRDFRQVHARDEREIEIELAAQWNRFIASGLRPTHLDSHHHIHQIFPSVYKAMANLATKENIPMRRSQTSDETIAPSVLKTHQVLLDTYEKPDGLQKLLLYLSQLPEGTTELMCHPGYTDNMLRERETSEWSNAREAELAVFRDPVVQHTIRELDIRPIHYGLLSSIIAQPTVHPTPNPKPKILLKYKRRKKRTFKKKAKLITPKRKKRRVSTRLFLSIKYKTR
ncbi:carbohydrate deacetylase [Cohnella herbarum]|uniref:ChbG/HpnK family deacetylase n=1 Tax=Cohnella herbarum TaxID=2728023 RepID=A0A7Z2ZKA3_9BACL|nr:ChbG/HpnK family deacetylase [Cohnella herbarum]QJD82986.1 ChbG/HpnK family deacetylase [Cohnella herbarum]